VPSKSMARISFLSISLAAKCRLLFGMAVLVIIAAALFVPWLRMRDLVHENNVQMVKMTGRLALAQISGGDGNWDLKQRVLDNWWPSIAQRHSFEGPPPRLIPVDGRGSKKLPIGTDDYAKEGISYLTSNPQAEASPPIWEQINGRMVYRTVVAVRPQIAAQRQQPLAAVITVDYPVADARAAFFVNIGLCLMAGALAGTLAVLVFYLITNRLILSPVLQLTKVAEAVSHGEHGVRSNIATGDEYEELSRAFNAMLTHLQSSENELRRINRSLDTRLDQLAEKNIELFEANKLKSQFLSNVSHELRTPLSSIIGFAELLRESASGEGERQYRYAENIMSSGRMLLGLINDLLDLAKIEAGKLQLHLADINLRDLLTNLIDFVRPLADKKSLQLAVILPDEIPKLHSDPGRMQQILFNLLSNAIKFTPDGGLVELSLVVEEADEIIIRVRDTGVGIPTDRLETVFEKFRQLDGSMTREHGGTGLGLAISRDLARLLGGDLTAASREGEGSTFTVRLPTTAPQDADTTILNKIDLAG